MEVDQQFLVVPGDVVGVVLVHGVDEAQQLLGGVAVMLSIYSSRCIKLKALRGGLRPVPSVLVVPGHAVVVVLVQGVEVVQQFLVVPGRVVVVVLVRGVDVVQQCLVRLAVLSLMIMSRSSFSTTVLVVLGCLSGVVPVLGDGVAGCPIATWM